MPLATTRLAARHAGNQGLRSASHGFAEEITNMDGQQFDAWTRLLTRGMSRRGTLKTIVAVALAGGMSRTVLPEAEANTGCADFGLPCAQGECCAPYTCRSGTPAICGYCLEPSAFCAYGGDCCSGICEFSFKRFWWVCKEPGSGGHHKAKCDGNGCHKKKHGKKGKRHHG
jgi:hypothetical protein